MLDLHQQDLILHQAPPKMRPLAPITSPTTSLTKLGDTLKQRSISFCHHLNNRTISTPWDLHATPDFVHRYTHPSGETTDMTAAETIAFFQDRFEKYPDYKFEIVDTTVHLEPGEKPTYATVWQTVVVKDGETPGERERVAIYSWRRETDKLGRVEWRWWRQECPSTAALVPF